MQAELARQFQAGVLSGVAQPGASERFAIYQNNVFASLIAALRARFGAVERLVGAEYFAAVARLYIMAEPPRSPVLAHWGEGFAAFLQGFAPLAAYPYLADVARLEFARGRACHAAQAPVPHDFTAPQLTLALQPSATILDSAYPLLALWEGQVPAQWAAQHVLVFRAQDYEILQRTLTAQEAAFLAALPEAPLLHHSATCPFDPTALLCTLLHCGALTQR